jgi:hypothetical protein
LQRRNEERVKHFRAISDSEANVIDKRIAAAIQLRSATRDPAKSISTTAWTPPSPDPDEVESEALLRMFERRNARRASPRPSPSENPEEAIDRHSLAALERSAAKYRAQPARSGF